MALTGKLQKALTFFLAILLMIPQNMALFFSLPEAQCKRVLREPRPLVLLFQHMEAGNQVYVSQPLSLGMSI